MKGRWREGRGRRRKKHPSSERSNKNHSTFSLSLSFSHIHTHTHTHSCTHTLTHSSSTPLRSFCVSGAVRKNTDAPKKAARKAWVSEGEKAVIGRCEREEWGWVRLLRRNIWKVFIWSKNHPLGLLSFRPQRKPRLESRSRFRGGGGGVCSPLFPSDLADFAKPLH